MRLRSTAPPAYAYRVGNTRCFPNSGITYIEGKVLDRSGAGKNGVTVVFSYAPDGPPVASYLTGTDAGKVGGYTHIIQFDGPREGTWSVWTVDGGRRSSVIATVNTALGLPRNAAGGLIGVASIVGGVYGNTGVSVCASGLSTKQAAGVDVLIDGALPATQIGNNIGTLRGASGAAVNLAPTGAVPAGAAYIETNTNNWTVCMKI